MEWLPSGQPTNQIGREIKKRAIHNLFTTMLEAL
jgi:hypothetical protein